MSPVRGRPAADDARAVRGGLRGERLDRELGAQHAGLGLEQHELEVLAAEAREQAAAVLDAQPLDRDALRAHRLLGGRLPAVAAAREPREPALDQEVRAGLGLELAPQRAGAARRRGVARVRAVAAADQARLAAGGRAAVAGLELVDERHAHALAREPPRQRGAERPCPDDHHGVHAAGRYRAARARPARRGRPAVRPLRRAPPADRDARRRGAGQGARRRLDPRQRDGRPRGAAAAPARAAARRASSCGWCDSVNPDGVRRGTRQNARGVDLNRNFARRWRGGGRPFDTYFPGRRAFSEPESQAVRRLVRRIRPASPSGTTSTCGS